MVKCTIALSRLLLVGLIGAATFEAVVLWLDGDILLPRVALVVPAYGGLWGIAVFAFGLRRRLKVRLILGAFFPYLFLAASVFGLWYIFVAIYLFWILMPGGIAASFLDHVVFQLTDRCFVMDHTVPASDVRSER